MYKAWYRCLSIFFGLPVLLEKSPQDSHPPDPDDFRWHTGVGCTLALTTSTVTTFPTSLGILANPSPGMYSHWLADDQTILDQLADVLPRVGIGDLVDFVGVEPDLVLAAAHHACGQALLQP